MSLFWKIIYIIVDLREKKVEIFEIVRHTFRLCLGL